MRFARVSGQLLVILSVVFLALAATLSPLDGGRPTTGRESAAEATSQTPTAHRR